MASLAVLGVILVTVLTLAIRMCTQGILRLDLDPIVLRPNAKHLRAVLVEPLAYAFEPLREALDSNTERARNLWMAEADSAIHHELRPLNAELRACARVSTSASFCAAAWALRVGLASHTESDAMALDGPIGHGIACIALGFLATGAVSSVHRRVELRLRDERSACAALLESVDEKENAPDATESRA